MSIAPYSGSKPPRRCRVSMARTVSTVQRALVSWSGLFELPVPVWNPERTSCVELAGSVKKLLAACPSPSEESRMAYQSIKKLLPPSCKCMESTMLLDLARRLTRAPRELPSGYMSFVSKTVSRLFPKAWDSGIYEEACRLVSPPLSSTLESPRRDGGCMGEGHDQSLFLGSVLNGFTEDVSIRSALLVVQSAGKPRPLSKYSSDSLLLRPLHGALYDHLSKFP